MEKRMLVVHENHELSIEIMNYFQEMFTIQSYPNGLQGLVKAIDWKPNIIILSASLQNVDGVELCRQLRESLNTILIICSSDLSDHQKINYYSSGADDIVDFPMNLDILKCKLQVHLKHHIVNEFKEADTIRFGNLVMNKLTYKIHYEERELSFTRKEFSILWLLVSRQEIVVTRSELVKIVWSYEHVDDDRMVDTHLNRLRKKLKQYEMNLSIKTVWGIGYKLQLENFKPHLEFSN